MVFVFIFIVFLKSLCSSFFTSLYLLISSLNTSASQFCLKCFVFFLTQRSTIMLCDDKHEINRKEAENGAVCVFWQVCKESRKPGFLALLLYSHFAHAVSLFLRNAHLCESSAVSVLCDTVSVQMAGWRGKYKVKQAQAGFGQSVLHGYLQAKKPRKNVLPCVAFIVMANHIVSHVAFSELQSNKLCFQVPTGTSGLCKLVVTPLEWHQSVNTN